MKKLVLIVTLSFVFLAAACSTEDKIDFEVEATRYLDEVLKEIHETIAPIQSVEKFEWICTEIDANNTYFIDCTYLIEMNEDVYIVAYMLTDADGHFTEAQLSSESEYKAYYEEIYGAVRFLEANPQEAEANHTTFDYGSFTENEILNRLD